MTDMSGWMDGWTTTEQVDTGRMFLTYALGLCPGPCQIRLAGSRGGALNQMAWLALKGHHTSHLYRDREGEGEREDLKTCIKINDASH